LHLEFLSAPRILLLLMLGAAIGGLGSYIWGRKACSGWAAAEASR
jgi:hypothetical protein